MFDRTKLPRLIFAVVCGLVLAAVSAVQAGRAIYDRRNPIMSEMMLGSDDARIALWTARTLTDPKAIRDSSIVGQAQAALLRNPLNPGALRALAFYYEGAKQGAKAETLATVSGHVSRRDPLTQLLLTQYAARAGKPDAALDHLDTALTTVDQGREQVFPIISAQLQNVELRNALPRLLETRNTWVAEYLEYVMRHEKGGPKITAEMLLRADPRSAAPVYGKLGPELASSLAQDGEIDLARRTYGRVKGSKPDVTRTVAFNRATIDAAIGWFAWSGIGDGAAGADLRAGSGGKVQATVYASAGTNRAPALRRVLFLAPGTYRHFERRTSAYGGKDAVAQFEMKCIGGSGATIWKGPVAGIDADAAGSSGPIVPTGCPAQMIELFVSSQLGAGGSEFVIEDFDLRRVG
ncbi:hypothetical protein ACWPMX_13110 [Tsuneonella sp. HG094]